MSSLYSKLAPRIVPPSEQCTRTADYKSAYRATDRCTAVPRTCCLQIKQPAILTWRFPGIPSDFQTEIAGICGISLAKTSAYKEPADESQQAVPCFAAKRIHPKEADPFRKWVVPIYNSVRGCPTSLNSCHSLAKALQENLTPFLGSLQKDTSVPEITYGCVFFGGTPQNGEFRVRSFFPLTPTKKGTHEKNRSTAQRFMS